MYKITPELKKKIDVIVLNAIHPNFSFKEINDTLLELQNAEEIKEEVEPKK